MITFRSEKLNIKKTDGGFTLIEVLIAVAIFAVSITALMSVLGKGISDITVSRNKLVANYLAQEGIELVRYLRDYDSQTPLAGGWARFISGTGQGIGNCSLSLNTPCGVSGLNPSTPPITCPTGGDLCKIVTDSTSTGSGAYDIKSYQPAWQPTVFTRKIYVDDSVSMTDARVIHSVVTWTQGLATYTISMSETLYNW